MLLDVALDLGGLRLVAGDTVAEHHERAHDRAALGVGPADHRTLHGRRGAFRGGLDLGRAML
jgi:hypothetical protein